MDLIEISFVLVVFTVVLIFTVVIRDTRRIDREVMRRYAERLAPVNVGWLHGRPLLNRAWDVLGPDAERRDVAAVEERMVEAINSALIAVSGEVFIDKSGRMVADPIGRENAHEIARVSWEALQGFLADLGEEVIP